MKFMRWESGWVSWLGPGYMKPVVLNPPWLLDSPGELLFLNNSPNILKHRWDWEPLCQALKTSQRRQALQRKASRRHYQSLNWRGNGWPQLWVAFVPAPRQWGDHITRPQRSLIPTLRLPNQMRKLPSHCGFVFPHQGPPGFGTILPWVSTLTLSTQGKQILPLDGVFLPLGGTVAGGRGGCQTWVGSVNYLAACSQGFSFLRKFWIQVKNQFVTVILSEPTYVSLCIAGELKQQKF